MFSPLFAVKLLTFAPFAYCTPFPFAIVFHPANVHPFNVYPFVVKAFSSLYVCELSAVDPSTFEFEEFGLLELYFTIYVCAVHFAYSVTVPSVAVVKFFTLSPFA